MSSRIVKRQLAALSADQDPPTGKEQKNSKGVSKAKRTQRKSKAAAAKPQAADRKQVYKRNLEYFKATKAAQSNTQDLMCKVRLPIGSRFACRSMFLSNHMLYHATFTTAAGQDCSKRGSRRLRRFLLSWTLGGAQRGTPRIPRRVHPRTAA